MIVYEERIRLPRLMSATTTILQVAGVIVSGFLLWSSEWHGGHARIAPIAAILVLLSEALPSVKALNGIVFTEVLIQISDRALMAARGLFETVIPLDEIVEVTSVPASEVERTTISRVVYQSSDFLFMDCQTLVNVKLLLSGGRVRYIATGGPEELAHALREHSEQFRRKIVQEMIAAHAGK